MPASQQVGLVVSRRADSYPGVWMWHIAAHAPAQDRCTPPPPSLAPPCRGLKQKRKEGALQDRDAKRRRLEEEGRERQREAERLKQPPAEDRPGPKGWAYLFFFPAGNPVNPTPTNGFPGPPMGGDLGPPGLYE